MGTYDGFAIFGVAEPNADRLINEKDICLRIPSVRVE